MTAPAFKRPGPACCRYAMAGAAFGCLFPLVATLVTGWTHHTGFGPAALAAMHRDPLQLIIDTASIFLGLFASLAGLRQDALNETLDQLAESNQRLEAVNADMLDQLKVQNARLESQNEELVHLGEAKNLFLANMSHEIRTPLTALLGFAELLLDPELPEARRAQYVATILRNGEHLMAVLTDILDISKIEAGMLSVEHIDCSPLELLQDVEALMGARAREKGLAFEIRLESPIPLAIRTDPVRLRQVLLNLVSNAIKFTDAGGVSVYVRFAPDAEGHGMLAFDVVDTGLGMTDVQLKRLFRPFQQADASTNRRFGGTGLGLAISRPLAQALGGDLEAKSAPGRGSTFMLRAKIEVRPGTASTTTLEVLPEATHRPTGDLPVLGGRVLLAEDGEDNRLLLSTLLGRLGLTVRVAENGQAAVEAVTAAEAAGEPFNLIFMDMQMPVLDGYGATAALRERGFTGPIVALTAGAMAGERERCLAVGCDDYHSKPIDRVTLATVARRHLRADAAPGRPLLSTLAHDPEMAELIHIFVGGLEQRVSALLAASHSGDHDALHTLAHQLKGAAGGYGYPTITEAAGALAQAITHGPEAAIARQFDHLVALCRQALAAQA